MTPGWECLGVPWAHVGSLTTRLLLLPKATGLWWARLSFFMLSGRHRDEG